MNSSDSDHQHQEQVRAKWTSLFYFTTRGQTPALALALCCSLMGGMMVPVLAHLLGATFDLLSAFGSQSLPAVELMEQISYQSLFLVSLGFVSLFVQTADFGLWATWGELQANRARETLFDALLRTDLEWFETTQDGIAALLPQIQTHIRDLQQATSQHLGITIQNIVSAIASLILALHTSWKLALICVATVPVCAVIMSVVSRKIQPIMEGQRAELTKAAKLASSAISSIVTVKHCNGEDAELQQYSNTIREAAKWSIKETLVCAIEIGSLHFLTFSMFVQGFWFGGYLVSRGELDPGQVLTTFWASFQATQAIENIIPEMMSLEKGRVAAGFLRNTLNHARMCRDVQNEQGKTYPLYCEGDIRFKNVTFAYPSQHGRKVLDDCSFFFPAGDMTFVVGKSGSGKSTLANLLMRFYKPSSGEIMIDGTLLGSLDINWIRNNVTLVQQNSTLFNETIIKNIAFGARDCEKISEDDIFNCIEFAGLSDMLRGLTGGFDTVVGLQGNLLSGGQRQRIALARSRLRDTPILILDESTSALDCASRVAVMAALRTWRKGKTTIVITHDLSQIDDDDMLYIVDKGKVVHRGYRYAVEREAIEVFQPFTPASAPQKFESKQGHNPGPPLRMTSTSSLTPRSPLFRRRRSIVSPNLRSMISNFPEPHLSALKGGSYDILSSAMAKHGLQPLASVAEDKDKPLDYGLAESKEVNASGPKRFVPLTTVFGTVLSSLCLGERFLLPLGFFCAVCHAAATPVFSYVFAKLLGTLFLKQVQSQGAIKWALAVVGISVTNGIASFGMHYLLERCGQAWIDHLRRESMRRILRQSRHWFEKGSNTPSVVANCLDRNAEEMKNLVSKFAGYVVVAVVMIVMGLAWALVVCWKLTLVGAACAPVLYMLTRMLDSVSRIWEGRCGNAQDIMAAIFAETFLDIRTVRALTLESYFHRKHNRANQQTLMIGLKRAAFTGVLFGLSDSSILFVYALIFYFGAILVSSLQASTEQIVTVFSMLLFSMVNVKAVLSLIPQINASRDNATRVLELATLPDISHEHRGGFPIVNPLPIRFTDVDFSYPSRPDIPILRNFSLLIRENTCTAIVGPSGSGKSTIASLLLSLYPVNPSTTLPGGFSGKISLGGIEIRRIHVPTLRQLVAVVPQHSTLFPKSIRENITYGLEGSSPLNATTNVHHAARAAGIHEFISSLPLGYDTVVGDGGLGLSGGQVQRIAIARALVRQPRVLILDEATSNLDGESAAVIGRTIKNLIAGGNHMTVIIITHKKEMMEVADRVVVMDRGRVVEDGKPSDLGGRALLRL